MSGTLLTNPQNPTAKKVGILIPILPKRNRRELKWSIQDLIARKAGNWGLNVNQSLSYT